MVIAVGSDAQFARLCSVFGVAEFAADPRFVSNKQRVAHRRELIDRLSSLTATRPTAHWVAALEAVGVPAGPINSLDAVFDDPQVRARGMRVELPHPVAGSVSPVANPLRLSETPVTYRSSPPRCARRALFDQHALYAAVRHEPQQRHQQVQNLS
jgi:crotonobetainyl-CoA:carnitine CoA-transferase CaiB-like acyl-CoA transferase